MENNNIKGQPADGIRIWLDDIRPAPAGYCLCRSVNEAKKLIEDSIGCRPDKRSLCVGSRSLTSHTMFNCDINAECFVRSLINMGTIITVR